MQGPGCTEWDVGVGVAGCWEQEEQEEIAEGACGLLQGCHAWFAWVKLCATGHVAWCLLSAALLAAACEALAAAVCQLPWSSRALLVAADWIIAVRSQLLTLFPGSVIC